MFVQAMELYQLLGIQKAFIYKTSCSATMETVLEYYANVRRRAKSSGGVSGLHYVTRGPGKTIGGG